MSEDMLPSALLVTVYLEDATAAPTARVVGIKRSAYLPGRSYERVPAATIHRTVQYIGGDDRSKILRVPAHF